MDAEIPLGPKRNGAVNDSEAMAGCCADVELPRAFVYLSFSGACARMRSGLHEPSKHNVQFVTVANGVRLEVLDWGGSRRPLVLLAGLGTTAHVFDGFAERLTQSNHVYGITRRGYGASSRTPSGYSEQIRAEDDLKVFEALS